MLEALEFFREESLFAESVEELLLRCDDCEPVLSSDNERCFPASVPAATATALFAVDGREIIDEDSGSKTVLRMRQAAGAGAGARYGSPSPGTQRGWFQLPAMHASGSVSAKCGSQPNSSHSPGPAQSPTPCGIAGTGPHESG